MGGELLRLWGKFPILGDTKRDSVSVIFAYYP